jgi:hypothetical protein
MLGVIAEGGDAVVPLDSNAVEFAGRSERGSPGGDRTPPVPEPVSPPPEIVEFQMPVSEGEALEPVPTSDGVIIPSDSHPVLEAPLIVVTYTMVEFDTTSVMVVTGAIIPLLANPVDPDPFSVVTSSCVELEMIVLTIAVPLKPDVASTNAPPVLAGVAIAPLPGITLVMSEA